MTAFTDYIYLKDKNHFVNLKKKTPISEAFMMQLLAKQDPKYQDAMEAAKCIASMKEMGVTQNDLSNKASVEDIYAEAKSKLPFKYIAKKRGGRAVYFIDNNNEATLLEGITKEDLITSLISSPEAHEAMQSLYDSSQTLSKQQTKIDLKTYLEKIMDRMLLDPEKRLEEEPKLISWSPSEVAFKKFEPDLLQEGSYDTWKEFLNRLDYPQVFMAWVWSVFEPENDGRQLMWLKGNGNDGKSRVISALMEMYGRDYTAALVTGDTASDFFFSKIYGKRFTVYDDCKQTDLITYEKIHMILGKGEAAIEYKGQNAFTGNVYSKIIVGSNMLPEISYEKNNERTRLICLTVKRFQNGDTSDNKFQEKLLSEKYAFLFACRKCYEVLCHDGVSIKLPEELKQKIKYQCTSQKSLDLMAFVQEKLIFDQSRYVESSKLKNCLADFLVDRNSDYKKNLKYAFTDLRRHLADKDLDESMIKIDEKHLHGFIGVGLKGDDKCILETK